MVVRQVLEAEPRVAALAIADFRPLQPGLAAPPYIAEGQDGRADQARRLFRPLCAPCLVPLAPFRGVCSLPLTWAKHAELREVKEEGAHHLGRQEAAGEGGGRRRGGGIGGGDRGTERGGRSGEDPRGGTWCGSEVEA